LIDDPTSTQSDATPETPPDTEPAATTATGRPRRRRAASRPSGAPAPVVEPVAEPAAVEPVLTAEEPVVDPPVEAPIAETAVEAAVEPEVEAPVSEAPVSEAPVTETPVAEAAPETAFEPAAEAESEVKPVRRARRRAAPAVTFQAPDPLIVVEKVEASVSAPPAAPRAASFETPLSRIPGDEPTGEADDDDESAEDEGADTTGQDGDEAPRRRRRRGRRGRGRVREDEDGDSAEESGDGSSDEADASGEGSDDGAAKDEGDESSDGGESESGTSASRRRTRKRRPRSAGSSSSDDDDSSSGSPRLSSDDEIRGVQGSTRLEAKRQRRRDSRDTSRRRVPVVTEAEFLARRESVNRVMVVRNAGERTQIAVLEDDVLVEHYVTRASSSSYAGNVYLGRVQNVLPSMEAAFVDIGKGRNGVLYAGEVNYDASGLEGKPRKIEQALKPGQTVVVQVTKDPIGHKGARLTSQVSLPGRYMVYVPDGGSAGISRKLPDSERSRLRSILKKVTPEDAGVIVRTAAEGASEDELARDISRLADQWEDIKKKSTKAAPASLLYAEPDLVVRVIRDIFNEDFQELVVQGEREWEMIHGYVEAIAPDLLPRLRQETIGDVFAETRVDEQLLKALDRKVYLPSGGSLVFDRTEAMTVVDVNTGRFTGKGGNLEETVTKNNLEAAEELVRQLRLRDVGGIIVVDFIDMVLESNRELVLRRLTECLGRDRTKHQVAEVTSLGLVQMTRKRVGQGLIEAYSEECLTCGGRGHTIELPSLGGSKSKPKPIPRPPLPRPLDEHGNEVPDVDFVSTEAADDVEPEPAVAVEAAAVDSEPIESEPAEATEDVAEELVDAGIVTEAEVTEIVAPGDDADPGAAEKSVGDPVAKGASAPAVESSEVTSEAVTLEEPVTALID
jgi:ribonuclease E